LWRKDGEGVEGVRGKEQINASKKRDLVCPFLVSVVAEYGEK
jgi:hypothetical protein